MPQPLDDWNEEFIQREVLAWTESATFERKAAVKLADTDELAKQVCAFANSGDGFLVYGISNKGALDATVPACEGREPADSRVEGMIPRLHHPPVENCQVKFIPIAESGETGVLVIFIPLSERRPHWTKREEIAYIRAGQHSDQMRPQTLIDIRSRGTASVGEIKDAIEYSPYAAPEIERLLAWTVSIWIRVGSGPMCEKWALEVAIRCESRHVNKDMIASNRYSSSYSDRLEDGVYWYMKGEEILFPQRWLRVVISPVALAPEPFDRQLEATLYLESAQPVHRTWPIFMAAKSPLTYAIGRSTASPALPMTT